MVSQLNAPVVAGVVPVSRIDDILPAINFDSQVDAALKADGKEVEKEASLDESTEHGHDKQNVELNEKLQHGGAKDDHEKGPQEDHIDDQDQIIRKGRDVSNYLLSDRDDGDAALTFRALLLGSAAAAFQATMNQLYLFKPTVITIGGAFLVVITYFLGNLWFRVLPTKKRFEHWGKRPNTRAKRWLVNTIHFINPGPFSLKEHAVAAITSNSASNGSEALWPFTVQKLFYNQNLTPGLVIMGVLSISLFGYGLCGLLRPIIIYPSSMVYWANIPLVQMFQKFHWENFSQSKPLRWFWYSFIAMCIYEIFPAYIFVTLVAFSIPCLASMHAPVGRQQTLTNLFGGSVSNEGLGLFSICFDWQYIQSFSVVLPLSQQANSWIGLGICYVMFIALYYGNAFGARDLPFLSTRLLTQEGGRYPVNKVFIDGVLDKDALAQYGLPRLTATYAYAQICGNAAIGALVMHAFLFWRKDVVTAVKESFSKQYHDRHQQAMSKYKEVHWGYYAFLLVFAFVLGLAVNLTEHTTLPVWGYIVSLILGSAIAPFSALLYGRFGNGIATNQLFKMVAGVLNPGRPIANLYFTAWSHSTVAQALNLAGDLKMGSYLKIPPFVMFATQIWGSVLGIFLNYAIMISVVNCQQEILQSANGSPIWTGQYFQSLSTQASVWALSKELYAVGKPYVAVPLGVVVGAGLVLIHAAISHYKPKIGNFKLRAINIPIICMYAGWLGFNQTQSCVMLSTVAIGAFMQYYLRNYHPRIFQNYSYIVTAGLDGGVLFVIFILSFAVFGTAGEPNPFPTWAGNPSTFPDHCPDPSS